ncbi:unnamed protein product [Rhizoctonia solani]|uniref:Uncharacterized protein n=1 Tax=Rhizoctonia solani TaxID=456999 RepID=A0A8H3DZ98_9AGAM|nr:unnamed protein product [Rhizoctonia solani]
MRPSLVGPLRVSPSPLLSSRANTAYFSCLFKAARHTLRSCQHRHAITASLIALSRFQRWRLGRLLSGDRQFWEKPKTICVLVTDWRATHLFPRLKFQTKRRYAPQTFLGESSPLLGGTRHTHRDTGKE